MTVRQLIRSLTRIVILLIFLSGITSVYAQPSQELQVAYIGLFINRTSGSSFFHVLTDNQERPYVPISQTVKTWMDLPVHCDINRSYCEITMQSNQMNGMAQPVTFWIDGMRHQMGYKGTLPGYLKLQQTQTIPADSLQKKDNELWLRYDEWSKWLPTDVQWDLVGYQLFFQLKFTLPKELKAQRYAALQQDEAREAEAKKELTFKPLEPKSPFNIQGQYRLAWQDPFNKERQSGSADYALNTDIFKGTLLTTGTVSTSSQDNDEFPSFWRYTLRRENVFHALEIGDVNYLGSLLVPSVNLENGVHFERLEKTSQAQGFQYQSHTIPGTEVDVYRNGILEKIITVGNDGSYQIKDSNASPGDTITLKLYHQSGREEIKTFHIAYGNNFILPAHQWNTSATLGHLTAYGQFVQAAVDYGLFSGFTTELSAYRIPEQTHHDETAGGVTIGWQPISWLNTVTENLFYSKGHDVDSQWNMTLIPGHYVQFDIQNMQEDSPIVRMQNEDVYAEAELNTGGEQVLPESHHFWKMTDNFSTFWNLRWSLKYLHASTGHSLDAQLSKSFGALSATLTGGHVVPKVGEKTDFYQLDGTYNIYKNTFVTATRLWQKDSSYSSVSLQRQGGIDDKWDASISAQKYDQEKDISWNAQFQWRITRKLSTLFNYVDSSKTFDWQVVWQDVLAKQPGPRYYENFATGTVAGVVAAPPTHIGEKPRPLKDVEVNAGGATAKTDEYGHYVITGLPTDTRVKVFVDPKTLDPSLVPDKDFIIVEMRPGTSVEYNPYIDMAAGMDGTVIYSGAIPDGLEIEAVDVKTGKVKQTTHVDPDGFFVFDKLIASEYYLQLKGAKNPPKPIKVSISRATGWHSGIEYKWD